LNGTGKYPAPAGFNSWLHYWSKKSREPIIWCLKLSCFENATDGAHVQLVNGGDEWYIVPLCHEHNLLKDAEFSVDGPLVPVNSDNDILPE